MEVPEHKGEDLPDLENVPAWTPSESGWTAIRHAHDNAGHPSKEGYRLQLKRLSLSTAVSSRSHRQGGCST
eukprot:5120358-Amphidinium_carterae.2